MRKVPYLQWEHIMLDTTIIFAYIQATRPNNTDARAVFVKRVIDDLNKNKSSAGKNRQFYISAISISEMYNRSTNTKKTTQIVNAMRIASTTFVSFDTDIAEYMTDNYHQLLGTTKQDTFIKGLNLPAVSDMKLVREWISKDLMILATAGYLNCDVTLTLDVRTMVPAAQNIGVFAASVEEANFNQNSTYIFDYTG